MKKRKILMGVLLSTLAASAISCGNKEEDPKEPKEIFNIKEISNESTAKLEYNVGEFVKPSDIILKAVYTSSLTGLDTVKNVTDFTISAVKDPKGNTVTSFDNVGKYTVSVTVAGKTKDFEINVTKKEFNNVSDAITYANAKDSLVNAGTATTTNIFSLNPNDEKYTGSKTFKQGNEFIEISSEVAGEKENLIYSLDKNDEVFAVQVIESGDVKTVQKYDYDVEKEGINGIAVDIFGDAVVDGYGAADTIKSLYEHGKEFGFDFVEKVEKVEEKTVYSYSFKSYESFYGFSINAQFSLGLFGNIENAKVTETTYYNAKPSANGDSFTLPDNPEGTIAVYEINQTTGDRLTDNEYLYSHLAVESFKVMDGNSEITDGQVINVDLDDGNLGSDGSKRQQYAFTISNYTPATANPDVDSVVVNVKGTAYDGTEIDQSSDEWNWDYTYVNVQTNGTVTFYTAGAYTVSFKSASLTKTITINVTPETPSAIGIKTYENLNDNSEFVDSTGSYTMYQSNVLYLAPSIAEALDQDCKVSLPDGTTGAAMEKETVKGVEAYKFTATSAGTYTVTFTAADDESVNNTITITVLENPNVLEMLEGTYYAAIGTDIATVEFTEGRVTTTLNEKSQSFAFRYEDGEIILSDPQGDSLNYNIIVDSKYELKLVDTDDNEYKLSTTMPEIVEFELAGEYSVSVMDGKITYKLVFEATNATTGNLTISGDGNGSATYSYVYDPATGNIVLTQTGDKDKVGENRFYVADGVLYYVFTATSVEYPCTKTAGGSDDDTLKVPDSLVGNYKDENDNEFEITETTIIQYNPDDLDATYTLTEVLEQNYTFTDTSNPSYTIVVTVDGDTITAVEYVDGSAGTSHTLIAEAIKAPQEMIGIWEYEEFDVTTTLEINETSLIKDNYYTYNLTSKSENEYTFTDSSDSNYVYVITINNDGTITAVECTYGSEGDSQIFTKYVMEVSQSLIGTWDHAEGDISTTFEITETSVTVDDMWTYELTSKSENKYTFTDSSDPNCVYVITDNYDGTITAVFYNNGEADPALDFDKRVVSKEIIGNWDHVEGDVSTTLAITETSLNDGMSTYNLTSKLENEYEFTDKDNPNYLYVITVINDGTITAVFYNNGEADPALDFDKRVVSEEIIGNWDCVEGNVSTSFEFDENTLTVDTDEYELALVANGTYTFEMELDSITYTYDVKINEDGTLTAIANNEVEFEQILTKRQASEAMLGTWLDSNGNTINVSETTLYDAFTLKSYTLESINNGVYTYSYFETLITVTISDSTLTITDSEGTQTSYTKMVYLPVPAELIGTWYDKNGLAYGEMTAEGFVFDGNTETCKLISIDGNKYTFYNSYKNEFTFTEDMQSFTYYEEPYTKTAPDFGEELTEIPEAYAGTYAGDYDTYTLDSNGLTLSGAGYQEHYAVEKIYASRMIVSSNGYKSVILFNEDGTITFNGTTLSKESAA